MLYILTYLKYYLNEQGFGKININGRPQHEKKVVK